MMIPEVDKSDLSTYFLSYGDVDSVKKEVKYPNRWLYENEVYGIPIAVGDDKLPEVYQEFTDNNVEFISNEPAIEGEEDVLNELNADSELMVGAGGNEKIQAIVEHASNGDEDFDDIMKEWNEKWSDAQDTDDVEVNK